MFVNSFDYFICFFYDFLSVAVREVEEETGLKVNVLDENIYSFQSAPVKCSKSLNRNITMEDLVGFEKLLIYYQFLY